MSVVSTATKSFKASAAKSQMGRGVSWKDATAYAKWLSEQTGKSYRTRVKALLEG